VRSCTLREKNFVGAHKSSFRDFLLKPELERAIADNAFEHPSDVQHECIPKAVAKTDIICQAKSGMGKTAVFVISILEQIQKAHEGVQAVVVCHTRELAFQVCQEFIRFSKYMDYITCKVYVGKYPIDDQVEELRGGQPSVIVGTPGRLFDLVERRALKVNTVQFFVVDECDHVLLESRMLYSSVEFRGCRRELVRKIVADTLLEYVFASVVFLLSRDA
jgi:ATP-dependent RNA helicase UAP56/SUB2